VGNSDLNNCRRWVSHPAPVSPGVCPLEVWLSKMDFRGDYNIWEASQVKIQTVPPEQGQKRGMAWSDGASTV